MSDFQAGSDSDSESENASMLKRQLPSTGVIIMNRWGKEVFRHGFNPPPNDDDNDDDDDTRDEAQIEDAPDLEQLKKLIILKTPAVPTGQTSVCLYKKGDEDESLDDSPVDYEEVWEPEQPEDSGSDAAAAAAAVAENLSDKPDDDVGYTKEVLLVVGMITDFNDHGNEAYSWYSCPLDRRLWIIYLPAGISWAHLKELVLGFSEDVGLGEVNDVLKQIDYVKWMSNEWSDPLKVEWISQEKDEVCRMVVERRQCHPPHFWEPWSDYHDDGASNLRMIDIVYHPSALQREIPVRQKKRPASVTLQAQRPQKPHSSLVPDSSSDPPVDPATALCKAAGNGEADVVDRLINQQGVDPNARDKDGELPLALAARHGHESVVKLLLQHERIHVNLPGRFSKPPLSDASRSGHAAVVALLLGHEGIDINLTDRSYQTPLAYAVTYKRDATAIKLLLECEGIDVNARDYAGRTPLATAAQYGAGEAARLLLSHKDVDVNAKNNGGDTILWIAAVYGSTAVVEALLQREDLNIDVQSGGVTPLAKAAFIGHTGVVELLLKHRDRGIDVNARTPSDVTPLFWAAERGNVEIVKMLLSCDGIDVNSKPDSNMTPLWWATSNGRDAVVRALLGHKDVDVNAKNNYGWTPLAHAAFFGHASIVAALVEHPDIDAHATNDHGETPLELARQVKRQDIVKLLAPLTSDP